MRLVTTCLMFALGTAVLISTGCSSNTQLRSQQQQSRERIEKLEAELQGERDKNDALASQLSRQQEGVAQIKAEIAISNKKFQDLLALYDDLAKNAGQAGFLPEEMNTALADFAAANSELLSYDPSKGLVKLKSDFTFDLGSDRVKPEAEPVLASLGKLCSAQGSGGYQVFIVGHTDDLPVVRPETLAKHPTNWHLSVHRAIAVMNILKQSMPEQQLAVMGFGQWRPVAPNQPNQRGNPLNRRVEVFIVPRGTMAPLAGLK